MSVNHPGQAFEHAGWIIEHVVISCKDGRKRWGTNVTLLWGDTKSRVIKFTGRLTRKQAVEQTTALLQREASLELL